MEPRYLRESAEGLGIREFSSVLSCNEFSHKTSGLGADETETLKTWFYGKKIPFCYLSAPGPIM